MGVEKLFYIKKSHFKIKYFHFLKFILIVYRGHHFSPLSPISHHLYYLFKYIFYWLCYYTCPNFTPCPPPPGTLISPSNPPLSSCPWVIHINSLATPFPIWFLPSPCLFCTYKFILLSPWIFPPISPSLLITLQRNSISMILFLFCLFA